MIAPGLSAELLDPGEARALLAEHPDAQTALRLVHGACSCDLVRFRQPLSREDEAHLRARYKEIGLDREAIVRALDNHRRALEKKVRPEGHWPKAVASFVVEHARNAGPTLYYLQFSHDNSLSLDHKGLPVVNVPVEAVRKGPGTWLPENQPVLVIRQ